nr:MAG TPA: hypothetical protein [Caudoviricetes sp.]
MIQHLIKEYIIILMLKQNHKDLIIHMKNFKKVWMK